MDSISDRELLELAAKAVGYWNKEFNCFNGPLSWDPLKNDADAFRLMVQLKLRINYDTVIEYDVVEVLGPEQDDFSCDCTTYTIEDDQCAAVCRAIVHAAAKIGKQLVDRK